MRETEILRGLGKARAKLHMAGGGIVPETTDQIIARMKAKYGTSGASSAEPEPAPAPAPTSAPAPQPQRQYGGLMGALQNAVQSRTAAINKATGYKRGGIVHGPGTGTSDSVPARLSAGEAVLPAKTVRKVGAHNIVRLIADTNNAPPKRGLRGGAHYAGGVVDSDALARAKDNADYAATANGTGMVTPTAPLAVTSPVTPTVTPAPQPVGDTGLQSALKWHNRMMQPTPHKDVDLMAGVDPNNPTGMKVGGMSIGLGPGGIAGKTSLLARSFGGAPAGASSAFSGAAEGIAAASKAGPSVESAAPAVEQAASATGLGRAKDALGGVYDSVKGGVAATANAVKSRLAPAVNTAKDGRVGQIATVSRPSTSTPTPTPIQTQVTEPSAEQKTADGLRAQLGNNAVAWGLEQQLPLMKDPSARAVTIDAAQGLRGTGIRATYDPASKVTSFSGNGADARPQYTAVDGTPTNDWSKTADFAEGTQRANAMKAAAANIPDNIEAMGMNAAASRGTGAGYSGGGSTGRHGNIAAAVDEIIARKQYNRSADRALKAQELGLTARGQDLTYAGHMASNKLGMYNALREQRNKDRDVNNALSSEGYKQAMELATEHAKEVGSDGKEIVNRDKFQNLMREFSNHPELLAMPAHARLGKLNEVMARAGAHQDIEGGGLNWLGEGAAKLGLIDRDMTTSGDYAVNNFGDKPATFADWAFRKNVPLPFSPMVSTRQGPRRSINSMVDANGNRNADREEVIKGLRDAQRTSGGR